MNPSYYLDKARRHLQPSNHRYPKLHDQLSFADYLQQTRLMVTNARIDLDQHPDREKIIDANSPFEYKNEHVAATLANSEKVECGILLVHGFTASPSMTQDVGRFFC